MRSLANHSRQVRARVANEDAPVNTWSFTGTIMLMAKCLIFILMAISFAIGVANTNIATLIGPL